jgi:pimeloyl-ACP methyl ester carboxylesterase
MAYTEWGARDNPDVVVCVHGLTRNGRDFDELAAALAPRYRVVCPDVVGRGHSDWLKDTASYDFPLYVADMVTLIARLDVATVRWVGTSMGGIIGMALAGLDKSPVRQLVLNDVGPLIPAASLARIGEYLGIPTKFPSLEAADAFLRMIAAPFGKLSDVQWRHLTETSVKQTPDGSWTMRYDPAIADNFKKSANGEDVNLWPMYDAISCPTLISRGADSDLLTHDTASEMATRGPKARLVEFAGVGHAPMFMNDEQIGAVSAFLDELPTDSPGEKTPG